MNPQSKIRQIQDRSANRDWRIDFISWAGDDSKPMVKGIENPMGILSLLGMMLFLGGFAYIMIKRGSVENMAIPISTCIIGVGLGAVGSILHEKVRKRNWITVNAECLDYETKLGRTSKNAHLWALRALCRFELNGAEVLCTPEITWPKRKGEEWKYSLISNQATCTLLVNPKRPREVELLRLKA